MKTVLSVLAVSSLASAGVSDQSKLHENNNDKGLAQNHPIHKHGLYHKWEQTEHRHKFDKMVKHCCGDRDPQEHELQTKIKCIENLAKQHPQHAHDFKQHVEACHKAHAQKPGNHFKCLIGHEHVDHHDEEHECKHGDNTCKKPRSGFESDDDEEEEDEQHRHRGGKYGRKEERDEDDEEHGHSDNEEEHGRRMRGYKPHHRRGGSKGKGKDEHDDKQESDHEDEQHGHHDVDDDQHKHMKHFAFHMLFDKCDDREKTAAGKVYCANQMARAFAHRIYYCKNECHDAAKTWECLTGRRLPLRHHKKPHGGKNEEHESEHEDEDEDEHGHKRHGGRRHEDEDEEDEHKHIRRHRMDRHPHDDEEDKEHDHGYHKGPKIQIGRKTDHDDNESKGSN